MGTILNSDDAENEADFNEEWNKVRSRAAVTSTDVDTDTGTVTVKYAAEPKGPDMESLNLLDDIWGCGVQDITQPKNKKGRALEDAPEPGNKKTRKASSAASESGTAQPGGDAKTAKRTGTKQTAQAVLWRQIIHGESIQLEAQQILELIANDQAAESITAPGLP